MHSCADQVWESQADIDINQLSKEKGSLMRNIACKVRLYWFDGVWIISSCMPWALFNTMLLLCLAFLLCEVWNGRPDALSTFKIRHCLSLLAHPTSQTNLVTISVIQPMPKLKTSSSVSIPSMSRSGFAGTAQEVPGSHHQTGDWWHPWWEWAYRLCRFFLLLLDLPSFSWVESHPNQWEKMGQ